MFQILDFTFSSFISGDLLYRVDLQISPSERYFASNFSLYLSNKVLYCIIALETCWICKSYDLWPDMKYLWMANIRWHLFPSYWKIVKYPLYYMTPQFIAVALLPWGSSSSTRFFPFIGFVESELWWLLCRPFFLKIEPSINLYLGD